MPTAVASNELYRRHAPTVFRRARQILGNSADAHEVVQDLFLSLFENPAQYAQASSLTTFLYAATTNACLNRLRNQKNRMRLLAEHAPALEPTSSSLSAEQLLGLQRALFELPEEQARAAVYYCLDGMSHDEIARVLGCSRRHVGNLLSRINDSGRTEEPPDAE